MNVNYYVFHYNDLLIVSLGRGRLDAAETSSLRIRAGATLRYQKRSEDAGEEVQNNNLTA
jgi:hypothetical protein